MTVQYGIFEKDFSHHIFIEYQCRGAEQDCRDILSRLHSLSSKSVPLVVAVGPKLWKACTDGFRFSEFGLQDKIPATQSDLFIWIQSRDQSDLFDRAMEVQSLLEGQFENSREIAGFVYHDSRDLTGFVDGIGNPEGDKAQAAAIVPEGQPGAGGSFVIGQKWIHDLEKFKQLPVPEQEKVIGRTKEEAIEFDDEQMPANAHVGRVDVDSMKIWRRSVPYGSTLEKGLYFLAFSCEQERFQGLLERMYGLDDDAVIDRLTGFTRPVSGSYWFAPPVEYFG